ncbi:hypothetical protein GLOIN_2v1634205 [Rhizophagus clarus]|uniref:Uncharacterized protein n=1 Tax=Rhizophagus clarus TaxID=94130 RepID=A0A8H3KTG4_9GLOM|nr:hypothetical protein GLOIN_2v1634205 [Rhizophagus clarus]
MANNSKRLNQLYEILLYMKKDIIAIQKKFGISGNANLPKKKFGIYFNPILKIVLRRDKVFSDKPIRLFDLFLSLKDDIMVIQDKLSIICYTNQARAEEVDENVRT